MRILLAKSESREELTSCNLQLAGVHAWLVPTMTIFRSGDGSRKFGESCEQRPLLRV